MTVRRKHIRSVADDILLDHDIDEAPVNVERIARSLGVHIRKASADDELSGFLYRERGQDGAIIGVNRAHAKTRQRFTIGHELGHFLLHDFDDVHVDRQFAVKLRSTVSSEGTDEEEKEANLFAAELLMPKRFIESDLEEFDYVDLEDESVVAELAKRYGVSTQAMTFRLAYLGYVQLG